MPKHWIWFLLFLPAQVLSQNIFDSLHTARYANYLFLSGNYDLAAEEYKRLLFFGEDNEHARLRLVQSLRLAGRPYDGLNLQSRFYGLPAGYPVEQKTEYIRLLIATERFDEIQTLGFLLNDIPDPDRNFLLTTALLLDAKYADASRLLQYGDKLGFPALESYRTITSDALNLKFKSPVLSGILSAIVPGSGKVYSGEWQDGIIGFLFTASTGWQAYRGFDKNGLESPYAWIMGAITAGFYAGNIYGSIKSANKHNFRQKNSIRLRVQAIYNHYSY